MIKNQYMSYSQFKDFLKCPACAIAKLNGEFTYPSNDAMLVGSYVDSWLDGDLSVFKSRHPELFLKNGDLKAAFKKAEELCDVIDSDEILKKLLKGSRQVTLTCNIAGVPFKARIDSLLDDFIVDGKVLKDCGDVWIDGMYQPFYMANRYDLQAAVYQVAVEQNYGKKLPFILAVVTKENVPDKKLFKIKQSVIDDALQELINLAPIFDQMKKGLIPVNSCGHCDYCKSVKVLSMDDVEEV